MDNLVHIQLGSGGPDQDTLLQKLIKMKLSPLPLWKIAVLRMKKLPVVAEIFFPSTMLIFNIPPCRKCQRRA
jgi:hypothetical protein